MGLGPILNRIDSSYNNALSVVRGEGAELPGFSNLEKIPPPPGNQVRQSTIANGRDASAVRNMVKWFLPEAGIVEMYINPKNIKYNYKKHIGAPTRTRGGFLLQYWGEELGTISINGTTGSSGVEGINVLEDIYRSEQVAMDALALASEAARDRDSVTNGLLGNIFGSNTMSQLLGNNLFDQNAQRFVINYFEDTYQFLIGDHAYYFMDNQLTGTFNWKKDPYLHENLLGSSTFKTEQNLFKAIIEQFNNRMAQDRLVIEKKQAL